MNLDTKLTAVDATDAKTPANSTCRRPESNGRRPGPGFDQNPGRKSSNFILLTRAFLGIARLNTIGCFPSGSLGMPGCCQFIHRRSCDHRSQGYGVGPPFLPAPWSSMNKSKGIHNYRDGYNVLDDLNSHAPSCSLATSSSPRVALQSVTRPVSFPHS